MFRDKPQSVPASDHHYYQAAAQQIEYPELDQPIESDALLNAAPINLTSHTEEIEYWDVGLQQAVQIALERSKVMRNLGGTVLRTPDSVRTSFDPAITETDPRLGVQAALAAFDTSFAASVFHQSNDRPLNNVFFGGGTRILQQQATVMQGQLSKQSASGTEFSVRSITDYDANNAPGNQFPGAWNSLVETEFRQPLLKGYGVDYWRTVGSSQTPGLYNGVLVSRTKTDISEAEFEIAVRDFIADVENSYWDLYYAYRNLEARKAARDSALELWRRIDALNQLGRAGGEADKEAQAREQYFRFEEEVQNAFNGLPQDGSRTYNGTSAGSFKGTGGVLRAERRLRFLIGLPINDCRLMRPLDEPLGAPVCFDWDLNLQESLQERPELRRQKWVVKKQELELLAAQKLLLPDLDVVGLYRWRGFGEALSRPGDDGNPPFNNALGVLASGEYQEWQLGVELDIPLGNRRGHTALRNAEFQLARSRQVLKEQERLIVHDLSNAMSEAVRAWEVLQTVKHRQQAAKDQVTAMIASFEADQAPVNLVLEAQRRLASAKTGYYSAVLDYNHAVRNVHYERGSYLEYCGVHLSEGQWTDAALQQAGRLEERKRYMDPPPRWVKPPRVISHGTEANPHDALLIDDHPLQNLPMPMPVIDEETEDVHPEPDASSQPELIPLPNP